MELWQQAAEWLQEVIPLDSSIRFHRLEEFAAFLKDGFALCALANKLSNGCVSQVRRNYNTGTSQFISESNLALFLNACRSTFGIAEKDLFRVEDLSDLEDFSKVLKVLSLLSRSRHAEMLGIGPFPHGINSRTSHHSLELPDEEAEIYMELRTKPSVDESATKFETSFDIYGTNNDEEIYNSFVYHPTGLSKYADFKPRNKREFCLKELLDTEINYCDTLKMIVDHFYTPMCIILDPDIHKSIFININELQVLHMKFLDKLRKAVLVSFGVNKADETDQSMRVPEIFVLFKIDFLKYTEYCSHLETSREMISLIEKTQPNVNKIVEEYRAKAGQQNVRLGDILTVPMQRILKYHLLLKQLLDNTSANDEELQMWDDAYDSMKDVSDFVNEGKRDHEIMGVIRLIQSKIVNFPSEEQWLQFGRLLQDGQVKVLDSTSGQKYKSRYMFLFEKVLLICKSKDEDIRSTHLVANFKVLEPEHESQLNRSSNTLTRKLTTSLFEHTSLMVLIKDSCVMAGDPQPYLQFQFRSTQLRDKWREMIEKAIDRNNPPNARRLRHKVIYQSYSRPTQCSVCSKLLLGLFYQGYHCQTCGKDMHFACLDLGQSICRQPTSSSLIHRSNSNTTTHILMHPQRFETGDRVQALQSVNSPDTAVLSFQKGDLIEVMRENEDGSLMGRLPNSPQKQGILSRDSVKKMSRSHSMINNNQSPTRTIDPNISRLSVSAGMNEQMDRDRRPSLVSIEIIKLYDDVQNMAVEHYPWYFGPLERHEAKLHLGMNPDGTFLVRQSKNQSQYVLSVLYNNIDKHILIEMNESRLYYLHGARFFHNIPSLINYYRKQSLEEGFNEMFTCLKGTPLKQTMFRAVHPFFSAPTETTTYLKLRIGDLVRVLDTNGEENGWWKGLSNGITGYFPMNYVEDRNTGVDVEVREDEGAPNSTEVY